MLRLCAWLSVSSVLAFGGFPTPTINAVTNGYSFGTTLCPGLATTIYGTNFGSDPTKVSVTVGGKTAFVYGTMPTQMNIQIPFAVPVGPSTVIVTVNGVPSTTFNVTISAVSPYFPSADQSGTGPILVYQASTFTQVTVAAPAHIGDALVAIAVGLGQTTPPTADTANGIPPANAQVSPLPAITVGGANAHVSFAGVVTSQYASLYQVNFTVPSGIGSGPQTIIMTMDGVTSTSIGVNNPVETLPISSAAAVPTISAVQNGAFGTALCPGIQAVVYGGGFGTDATKVSFTVGGKTGYVFPKNVTPNQMLVQIPFEAATGPVNMIVTVNGTPSAAFSLTLAATAPTWVIQASALSGPASVFETSNNALVALTIPTGSPANTVIVTAKPGDTLYGYAMGLGPTSPVSATGVQTAADHTATVPTVTVGGIAATDVSAVLTTGFVAIYQVNFTVPAGAQGTAPLVISIGGNSSGATTATLAVVGLSAITNNASFANPGTASPGSIVSGFANGLGTTLDEIAGVFPQSQSEGVQLTFTGGPANGESGPLFHVLGSVTPQQVDLLVPTDLPSSGTVTVQLSTTATKYPNYTLNMVPANPGIYRIQDPSKATRFNVIAQFNNTTWLAMPASMTTALGLPACTKTANALTLCGQPAQAGDVLVLYVTGLGLATPGGDPKGTPLATGQVAPVNGSPLYQTPAMPTVTIGGVPVTTVYFSGLAPGFAGLYQIDVLVPPGISPSDDSAVVVTMGGLSDTATISIQPRAN